MNRAVEAAAGPPRALRFRRDVRFRRSAVELWRARELVRTLAERDLRARYKRTVFGAAWAIILPVVMMVAFTLVIRRVARVDTSGVPYPLFAYIGLLPWTFFTISVSTGSQSLRSNMSLLNKVYCPREVFPLSSVAVAAVDTCMSALVLGILFGIFRFAPRSTVLWVPALLLVLFAFTFGVTLVCASVSVYFRDLRHALPILLQVGLFVTPVAYGLSSIPGSVLLAYSAINPLVPVIDGFRRVVLFGMPPQWDLVLVGGISSVTLLVGGYLLFKRLETGFADVA